MQPPFKLPTPKNRLEDWEKFELKITNLFKLGLGCSYAEKTFIAGFEIDCLAKDNNSVFVIECKTKAELSKTNQKLRDYILLFAGKKTSISNELRERDRSRELIFLLCTDGFEINDKNAKLASDNGIYLWDGGFIRNAETLFAAIGPRIGQYILSSLDIHDSIPSEDHHKSFRIPALAYTTVINGTQKAIYNLFLSAEHLLDLGYVFHIANGDPEAYQRLLKTSRLKGIGEFINEGNTFNSSIVTVLEDNVRFEGLGEQDGFEYKTGFLYIPKRKSSVRIIDGQHRLYGYMWAEPEHMTDKLPVLALQNVSSAEQAKIFLDINDHQSPVKKDDLNWIMARTDPHGTGYLANVVLRANERGALKGKFKTPMHDKVSASINLANAVKGLGDRSLFSRATPLIFGDNRAVSDEVIDDSVDVLEHYYKQISDLVAGVDQDWVTDFVYTNNGFNILLYLLSEVGRENKGHYKKSWLNDEIQQGLTDYFRDNRDRISEIRQMSSEGGRRENAKALIYEINKYDKAFGARFVKDYVPRSERIVKTKGEYLEQISDIENGLKNIIISTLSKTRENWWLSCVPSSTRDRIVSEMNNESQSYLEIASPSKREDYLTFGDISYVVDRNWSHFSKIFGNRAGTLNAIEVVKHIRNKLSHGKDANDLSSDEKEQFHKNAMQLQKRMAKR